MSEVGACQWHFTLPPKKGPLAALFCFNTCPLLKTIPFILCFLSDLDIFLIKQAPVFVREHELIHSSLHAALGVKVLKLVYDGKCFWCVKIIYVTL